MLTPRYYQLEAIDSVIEYLFDHSGNPLVWIPTAGGKALIQAEIAKRIYEFASDQQMIFLTDITALIGQNKDELMEQWPDANTSVYSASYGQKNHNGELVFCGIQSVYKQADLFKNVSVIFIDEVHRASLSEKSMYKKFIDGIKKNNPFVRIVSMSATPWKLNTGTLEGTWICDKIVYKIEMKTLFDEGFLCPLLTPPTSTYADTSGLKVSSTGEFDEKAMQELMNNDFLIDTAIDDAMKFASNRNSILVFASGVDHAERVRYALLSRGETAEVIIGETDTDERKRIIDDFRNFKLRWIISVGTLTTGFNAKNADLAIILRATQSSSLWMQMLGRLLRTHESKTDAMVLDYGQNVERFGPVDMIGPPPTKEQSKEAKRTPFKICHSCEALIKYLDKSCPFCFIEFGGDTTPSHGTQASTGKLMDGERNIQTVNISRVSYSNHYSHRSKNNSLRVTYHHGLEEIHDYFDFETQGWQRARACKWWATMVSPEIANHCPKHLQTALVELRQFGMKEIKNIVVDYTDVKKTSGANLMGHKILSFGLA